MCLFPPSHRNRIFVGLNYNHGISIEARRSDDESMTCWRFSNLECSRGLPFSQVRFVADWKLKRDLRLPWHSLASSSKCKRSVWTILQEYQVGNYPTRISCA